MKILVVNSHELDRTPMAEIASHELVIGISEDGVAIRIVKNRHGAITENYCLPLALLPKVISNPRGVLVYEWL